MAGLCFLGTVSDSQAGVVSVQGALFILVSENTFSPMYSVLSVFPSELPLFLREYRAGLYGPVAFYASKVLSMVSGTSGTRRGAGGVLDVHVQDSGLRHKAYG